eukprot:6432487-Prymnesium_polylepis.1
MSQLCVQSSCVSGLSGAWDLDTRLHDLCVKRAEPVGGVGMLGCGLISSLAIVAVRCLRAVDSVESKTQTETKWITHLHLCICNQ